MKATANGIKKINDLYVGSEPGTIIPDSKATVKSMHYNMIFENAAPLEKLLADSAEPRSLTRRKACVLHR